MEPRTARRTFLGGQLAGIFPLEHAATFLAAFRQVALEREVTFLSIDGEVEMWVKPPLAPAEWEQWDEAYERVCKELELNAPPSVQILQPPA